MTNGFLPPAENEAKKIKTYISTFDEISKGGIPGFRSTLVSGTSGSGKTIFIAQFLANRIIHDNEPGVFVTFEEIPQNISNNLASFGWDIPKWEKEGKFKYVNVSVLSEPEPTGEYNLSALITRIEIAVKKINAKNVVVDSLSALLFQFRDEKIIRRELIRLTNRLKEMDVTLIMTAERASDYGQISIYGIEEFISDNVITDI